MPMNEFWTDINAPALHSNPAIQVYQTNVLAAKLKALEENYPLSKHLLGERLFQAIARHFAQSFASTEDSLNLYGAYFTAFLAELIPCNPQLSAYPYLAELAEIEWLLVQAYFAEDDDSSGLLAGDAIIDAHTCIQPVSSLGLCKLSDPSLTAFWAHHADASNGCLRAEEFSSSIDELTTPSIFSTQDEVPKAPLYLAVYRSRLSVLLQHLSETDYVVLKLIREGTPLFTIQEQLELHNRDKREAAAPASDSLAAMLKQFQNAGLISGLTQGKADHDAI